MKKLLVWSAMSLTAIGVAIIFTICENTNRITWLRGEVVRLFDARLCERVIIIGVLVIMAVISANTALRQVLTRKERLLLLGATVSLTVAMWTGISYMANRTFARSLDATIEYYKLMRKWEPIWAEQAKMKELAEQGKKKESEAAR